MRLRLDQRPRSTSRRAARSLFFGIALAASFAAPQAGPILKLPDTTAQAQGPLGAYVVADTWDTAPSLPPDAWPAASGIAADATGNIYVADAAEARISVIEPGGIARILGQPGLDLGLVEPRDLAVDNARDRLYALDPGQQGIAVLGLDGSKADTLVGLSDMTGLGVDPEGIVYVGDAKTGQVHRFDADGGRMASIQAVNDRGFGAADLILGIDVAADGTLAVLDGTQNQLILLPKQGRPLDPIEMPVSANDVIADHSLGIFVRRWYWFVTDIGLAFYDPIQEEWQGNPVGRRTKLAIQPSRGIMALRPSGSSRPSEVERWDYGITALTGPANERWGAPVDVAGRLQSPESIALGEDGRVYLLDLAERVQRFTPDGDAIDQILIPRPLSVDGAGDRSFFVTDGLNVEAREEDGSMRWRFALDNNEAGDPAAALVWNAARNRLAVLDREAALIRRYRVDATPEETTALPPAEGRLGRLWSDLAAGADGRLYALDLRSSEVLEVANDGSSRTRFTGATARRIDVRSDGVLMALGRDGWVRGFDEDGLRILAFRAARTDLAPGSRPSDIAIDDAGDVYVADRRLNLVTRFTWDPTAPAPEAPEAEGACEAEVDKAAAPASVQLGDAVEIELRVGGECADQTATAPLDIVLIIDRSGSMRGEPLDIAIQAAMAFVAETDLSVSRIGVVSFAGAAIPETSLTGDEARIRRALQGIVSGGGTRIDLGLAEANREVLRNARAEAQPVFILLSDGASDRLSATVQADIAKQAGVEVYTIGIQADEVLMRAIASSPDHYFSSDRFRLLFDIFEQIAERIEVAALFRSLTVTDTLPDNMQLVPDSAVPAANLVDPGPPVSLRWRLEGVPLEGVTLRFRVEPLERGLWPTNRSAKAEYVDGYGRQGTADFPVPEVMVIGPTPTATPTPRISPTPTASPTRTPGGSRVLFLPLLLREQCKPDERHADIVLVVDTSGSMVGRKLDAAADAARSFVALLDLGQDQVGLVSFDADAQVEARLGSNASDIDRALSGLTSEPGTRIDRGLTVATIELLSGKARPGNTPVVVLLTDGVQNDRRAEAILAADQARAARIQIYSVGLGDGVDADLLRELAGSSARSFQAPGPEDLARIYAEVASIIPCPPEDFWSER